MPNKTYVLDTSVLLAAPGALLTFEEHEVVLPLVVIKELEGKRKDPLVGYQARTVLRTLEELSDKPDADLKKGIVATAQNGTVRIEVNHIEQSNLPEPMRSDLTHDTRILAVAKNLTKDGLNVVLVSRDLPMRLLAETLDVPAEDYRNDQIIPDRAFTGKATVETSQNIIDDLFTGTPVSALDLDLTDAVPNLAVVVKAGQSGSALAVVDQDKDLQVIRQREVFGLKGRSNEQHFAIEHLMNPDVGVVSLGGAAGTGKTLLALAAGLEQVMEDGRYKKVVVFRPLHAVGQQEVGFLPGTMEEKMAEPARAITDALEAMTSQTVIEEVTDRGLVEVLPVTYIRGRTLTDSFIIIDEAQNLEQHVLLSVLSRAGRGTKMVLCWDAAQRDNLHVGRYDGISTVVERLKGEPLFAHISLVKSERSAVAEMVTRLLDQ